MLFIQIYITSVASAINKLYSIVMIDINVIVFCDLGSLWVNE